jgi:hypothetical protein
MLTTADPSPALIPACEVTTSKKPSRNDGKTGSSNQPPIATPPPARADPREHGRQAARSTRDRPERARKPNDEPRPQPRHHRQRA